MDARNSGRALPSPARYFPLERGLYEVAPGLRTLGSDFGNGEMDARLFQIDRDFAEYRANTVSARVERLQKYVCTKDFLPEVRTAVSAFLIERMTTEYPDYFRRTHQGLDCALTGESLNFNDAFELTGVERSTTTPPYTDAFDALAAQVPEDLAILIRRDDRDWLAALSLTSPSHWAAEDKIGRDFFSIHAPVPGIDKLNRAAAHFVEAMIHKGPYVRFVWGFASDRRLNHHPEPAPGVDPALWRGRVFRRGEASPFQIRVERQVTWGLPSVEAALFSIRVSFIDGAEIRGRPAERALLRSALLSMTPESLRYKGLDADRDEVVAWLDAGPD